MEPHNRPGSEFAMPESPPPDETPAADPAVADAEARLDRLSKEFDDIRRSLAQLRRIAKPDPAMPKKKGAR